MRPSPSSTVTTRRETPALRTIEVATASEGLTIAPSARQAAIPMPGAIRLTTKPITPAEIATSRTASTPMGAMLRRKSETGMLTAAE